MPDRSSEGQRFPLMTAFGIYTVAFLLLASPWLLPFVRVPWDGRDRDGDILANGVYFYRVLVSTADGRFSSEAIGKLAITR